MKKSFLLLLNIIVLLNSCSDSTFSGGGSDIPNGIIVAVRNDSVTVLAKYTAIVSMFSTEYYPESLNGFSWDGELESRKPVTIVLPQSGSFNILAWDPGLGNGILIDKITAGKEFEGEYVFGKTFVLGGRAIMKSDSSNVGFAYVFIMGTPFSTITDVQGYFTLSNVPEGNYTVKARYIEDNPVADPVIFTGTCTLNISETAEEDIVLELE